MKIYLAGTPGIREREEMAGNYERSTTVILGYSTGPI